MTVIILAEMMCRNLLLSVRREYSRGARVLFALLAIIEFIAPTWHVCEMGGASCCPPKTEASAAHCSRRSTPVSITPHCARCPKPENNTPFAVSQTPTPQNENCLAKLLLAMPWQNAALPSEAEYSSRHCELQTPEYAFSSFVLISLPPGRAPPFCS